MQIICNDEKACAPEIAGVLEKAAEICLELENIPSDNAEISLSFVSLDEIHQMNKEYRDVDRPTDVLSFPMIEDFDSIDEEAELLLGDVVICLDKVYEQAEEFGHSRERECVYLFVHSMCHLLGYDHMTDEDKKEMRSLEEDVMKRLDLGRENDEIQ